MIHPSRIFAAFALLLLISSCSKSTEVVQPGTTVVIPKTGSIFILENKNFDSSNVETSTSTEIDSIAATGLTLHGKSNCIIMLSRVDTGAYDSSILAYESDGDISFYSSEANLGVMHWATFPFGSKRTGVLFSRFDTTMDFGPFKQHMSAVSISNYVGTGTATIKGQTFATQRIQIISNDTTTIGSNPPTIDQGSQTMEFAPALGYITSSMDASVPPSPYGHHTTILIDYKLAK
jgi:hypothetical protein